MAKKMKALRKVKKGKGNMAIEEVPIPEIKPNEVLMKVYAAGVCGSDILIEDDKHFNDPPVTTGHEFSGVAYKVGKEVENIKEGDHIVGDIETETGWLGVTRNGSFASYMSLPEKCCYKLPEDFNMDYGAMTELVTATIHIMQERTTVKAGDFALVIGHGPMALLAAQFAKIRGAAEVAMILLKKDQKTIEVGKKAGVDHILFSEENPEEKIKDLTGGIGADYIYECAGSKIGDNKLGLQHAIDCSRKAYEGPGGKGEIACISLWDEPISLKFDQVCLGQVNIHGCWSWNGPETWRRSVKLVTSGMFDFEPMITGRFSLEEWKQAFEEMRSGKGIKGLFYPNGRDWL